VQFDLIDLKLFGDVVEAGSITHGAERSALALAAASTRIRNMERSLGAPLLTRSRHGVVATAAGQVLLVHARALLSQSEKLREDLSAYANGTAGQVRVLSNTNALTEFLPSALGQFLADHPGVSIDLQERLSDEIVGLVAEGAAEIGIVAATVEMGSLETFPFRSDRFVLVVARGNVLARRKSIAFADVIDRDVVGLERSSALQRFLSAQAARLGHSLRLRVQLRSFDAICRLVESDVGIGIVPLTTAMRASRTMKISIVMLTDRWAERELRTCVRRMADLTPLARALLDHLRNSRP
jgi:DNA-binding transcriptional LysR family regulator